MMQLSFRLQNAIEARLRRQPDPLIQKIRNNLRRRQGGVSGLIANRNDGLLFCLRQLVPRLWTRRHGTLISQNFALASPAPPGTQTQSGFLAGPWQASPSLYRFTNQCSQLLALREQGQLPSSSSPQSALSFFRSTSKAAVSASAFSLCRNSRLSALISALSALLCCRSD